MASRTGELAYSTVVSSWVITGSVVSPGDPDLGGDFGGGDGVVAQGVGGDGCWDVLEVLVDRGGAGGAGGDAELGDERGRGCGVHGLFGAVVGEQLLRGRVGGGVHVVLFVDPGGGGVA